MHIKKYILRCVLPLVTRSGTCIRDAGERERGGSRSTNYAAPAHRPAGERVGKEGMLGAPGPNRILRLAAALCVDADQGACPFNSRSAFSAMITPEPRSCISAAVMRSTKAASAASRSIALA